MKDEELLKRALKGLKEGAVAEIIKRPRETYVIVYPHGRLGEKRPNR